MMGLLIVDEKAFGPLQLYMTFVKVWVDRIRSLPIHKGEFVIIAGVAGLGFISIDELPAFELQPFFETIK
ncbi:MAG: hypothetical protein NVS3B19_10200 [Ginsengibacter sp.]